MPRFAVVYKHLLFTDKEGRFDHFSQVKATYPHMVEITPLQS